MQDKIRRFWEWFKENEYRFKKVDNPGAVVEMLNEQILEFGMFRWEIGSGENKPYYLVISPNGNAERLKLSKEIIAVAPKLPDWEFHYCKPPKNWDFVFEMYDSYMIKQQFDASKWTYSLEKKGNNKIAIQIKADNITLLDRDDHKIAADLVITNIIGEEMKIKHLDSIEMVFDFAPENEKRSAPMKNLKWAFSDMIY